MDQGIGVDTFQGAGDREELRVRIRSFLNGLPGSQTENGADAFSAGKEAVAHGLYVSGKDAMFHLNAEHVALESIFDSLPLIIQIGLDLHCRSR